MELGGAWDRYNPRLLGQQPRERDLSRSRFLPFSDAVEQMNEALVGLESIRREARQGTAKVGAVELQVFVHFPRKKALAQGAVRHKTDAEFLQGRYHFLFRSPRP